jgi:hypothetical protein
MKDNQSKSAKPGSPSPNSKDMAAYTESMQAYLARPYNSREKSPEFRWTDPKTVEIAESSKPRSSKKSSSKKN